MFESQLGGITNEIVIAAAVWLGYLAEQRSGTISNFLGGNPQHVSHGKAMQKINQPSDTTGIDPNSTLWQALGAEQFRALKELYDRTPQQRAFIAQQHVRDQMEDTAELLKASRPKGGDGRG